MTYFILYDSNTTLLGVHPGPDLPELPPGVSYETKDGPVPDLNKQVWDPETLALVQRPGVTLTRLEFMSRFTIPERVAVWTATDPVARDIVKLIEVAEFVDPADPQTVQAINYLAQTGLIAQNRVGEVLR